MASRCTEYRDDGHSACNERDSKCCTWWPCSWACKLLTWICVGWVWIANLICIAWEVIVTVVTLIVEIIGMVVKLIVGIIAFLVELIFSIPIVGAFLKELWNIITDVFWRIIGLGDAFAWSIGIKPEKKMRICTIILRDEKGPKGAVADTQMVVEEINRMIAIYREEANIRVIPTRYFYPTTPFADTEVADESWVHVMEEVSGDNILDVHCGVAAVGEDYLSTGSSFNLIMATTCFWGNVRRLTGYGAPITVFIVRSIDGSNSVGCSLWILSNYVTVVGTETTDKRTIAHECGHACLLADRSDPPNTNLMWWAVNNNSNEMTDWQALVVRNSKHVTYF